MPTLVEDSARSTLLASAVFLILGIAAVGIGFPTEGALVVVVGLALTILSIHLYGRLGPDEGDVGGEGEESGEEAADLDARRTVARARMWRGGVAVVASAAATAGTYTAAESSERILLLAVPTLWGLSQLRTGWRSLQEKPAPAPEGRREGRGRPRVEKRRRVRKSPPP